MTAVQVTARARYVGIVALALAGAAAGAVWWALPDTGTGTGSLIGFTIAMAVGEFIVVDEPDGRPVPASIAVLGAFVLLGNDPVTTALVAIVGFALAATAGVFGRAGHVRPADGMARIVAAWSLPAVAGAAADLAPGLVIAPRGAPDEPLNLLAFAMISVAIVLGLPFWDAVETGSPLGTVIGPLYVARLRGTWLAGVALAAGAGLTALLHADLGSWGLLLTLLPLLAARSGLRRLASVRRTHAQTVRAMSRIPEFVNAAPAGHGDRVAALAVSMGRDLGLTASAIDRLERAALLHEVGVVVTDGEAAHAADASASVVHEVPHLADVAEIIRRHRDTHRMGLVVGSERVPLPARILRTACEFDRIVAATDLDPNSWDAVHHFHVTMGHQHEPGLIQALGRTIDRRLIL